MTGSSMGESLACKVSFLWHSGDLLADGLGIACFFSLEGIMADDNGKNCLIGLQERQRP